MTDDDRPSELEFALRASCLDPTARQPAPERKLGGTDIASLLGVSKWGNVTDVAMRILYGIGKKKTKGMVRGLHSEDDMRVCYENNIRPIEVWQPTLTNAAYPWFEGHPDAYVGGDTILDLKTCSRWNAHAWGIPGTDKVRGDYVAQFATYCMVSGRTHWQCLVGFGEDVKVDGEDRFVYTEEPRLYLGQRDKEFEALILKAVEEFRERYWEPRILPDVKPLKNVRDWKRLKAKEKTR